MKYGSVCSGIEAASVAWGPLGFEPAWFSEIEAFPSAVLDHHYPSVLNLGDMTKLDERKEYHERAIDILVGGTPSQSFSVAGLRKGLADPRGNLALYFLKIVDYKRPRWVVWENVPGVLSSWSDEEGSFRPLGEAEGEQSGTQTNDFDTFLAGLSELGYGVAWRILDAQYLGVPQRRRRVFVIGYLGDWRPSTAVLFESQSLSGNPPPSREAGEGIAPTISARPSGGGGLGTDFDLGGGLVEGAAHCLEAKAHRNNHDDNWILANPTPPLTGNPYGDNKSREGLLVLDDQGGNQMSVSFDGMVGAMRDNQHNHQPVIVVEQNNMASTPENPSLRASETPNFAVAIRTAQTKANGHGVAEEVAHTLDESQGQAVVYENHASDSRIKETDVAPQINARAGTGGGNLPLVGFKGGQGAKAGGLGLQEEQAPTLGSADSGSNRTPNIQAGMMVRRLTPRECERLQGFPDDYTLIPFGKKGSTKKKQASDGPRYKALGNSMAVPVMGWIAKRILMVEEALLEKKKEDSKF